MFEFLRDFCNFTKPRLNNKDKAFFSLCFIFMIASVVMEYPAYYIQKFIIDEILIAKSFNLLIPITLLSLLFSVLFNLIYYFQDYLYALMDEKVVMHAKEELYNKLLKVKIGFIKNNETGYILSRFNDDIEKVSGIFSLVYKDLTRDILVIIVTIFIVFYINWKLALISLIMLPFFILNLNATTKILPQKNKDYFERRAEYQKHLSETILGNTLLKLSTYFEVKVKIAKSKIFEIFNAKLAIFSWSCFFSGLDGVINWFGPGLVMLVGGFEIAAGRMTTGELLMFVGITSKIVGPTRRLLRYNMRFQTAAVAITRMNEMLELEEEEYKQNAKKIENIDKIELSNVSFSYKDGYVFENLNYTFRRGKNYLLKGENGSGKSTIFFLIAGLLRPSQGKILVNDINLDEFDLRNYRKKLLYIEQDPFLFNDTVKANLVLNNGNPDANHYNVSFLNFINELENKENYVVGENGSLLSGGQKRRVAVGRIIYHDNAELILLDEITSNISENFRLELYEEIIKLNQNKDKIVICISHDTNIEPYFDEALSIPISSRCPSEKKLPNI